MPLNSDFTTFLKKYGRLPNESIDEHMEAVSKLSHLEERKEELEELVKKDLDERA